MSAWKKTWPSSDRMVLKISKRFLRFLVASYAAANANAQVRNNELSDLESFVMSPGQDIPVAAENVIIILVISASKIKRRFARRIGHQKNG